MAVLMGANSRTYKFALGSALLTMAQQGRDSATLEELAVPYAMSLVEHAGKYPQGPQSAVQSESDFLSVLAGEAAASRSSGEPTETLREAAIASMPTMVMQKFHNLRGVGEVPHSFYRITGRGRDRRVELTPELLALARHEELLRGELDSRWAIVEACFDAELGRTLVDGGVVLSDDGRELVAWQGRRPVTGARTALAGFQHGRCFYCRNPLTEEPRAVHVDHAFPYALMKTGSWLGPNLNGVWNLVVACSGCNLTKSSRLPTELEVRRLIARNEAIFGSPHPLRRTLELSMRPRGAVPAKSPQARLAFVQEVDRLATDLGLG